MHFASVHIIHVQVGVYIHIPVVQGVLWIRISLRQLEYVYVQFLAGNADQQTQISVSYVSVKTYFGARFSSSFARLAWSIVAIGNRWLWDTVTRRYSQLLDAWKEGTIP